MKKPFLLTIIAVFFAITSTVAQNMIKGKITDASTSETLPGASVMVKGTTLGTVADYNGEFKLSINESGKITLQVSYIGYETKEVEVDVQGETNAGTIKLQVNAIGLEEISIISSVAIDRQTPVAVSSIGAVQISEKLGNQEFPELLKSTPSVYATKAGGGFGDARIYLRGFDSNNIGILINGIPVNDMESGKVYWSNWAGLSDVTSNQQVQRGLGASKLALSSVGGTINVITRSTEVGSKGTFFQGVGNDGFYKQSFAISTGMNDNGWAATFAGGHTWGDGYINGTNFEGWNYFVNISKVINEKHRLTFNAFGAPQWHNQRSNKHSIEEYRNHPDGAKWNSDYGFRNGELYTIGYAYNYYHKPQLALNHFWKMDEHTSLTTQVYASIANGGGRRVYGANSSWLSLQFPSGKPYDQTLQTEEGYIDFDAAIKANSEAANGSTVIIANGINSHDWYGGLSTFTKDINALKLTAGIDSRYYKGYHAYEIEDLLGGDYFLNASNMNRDPYARLKKGDYINYYNLGEVFWAGGFTQAEFIKPEYTGFISFSAASNSYRRTDYFQYVEGEQVSPWKSFVPWNVKGGFNYNLNENHNVFINAGYIKRAPAFANTFLNYRNDINHQVKYETIKTVEFGYGFTTSTINAKLNLYRTQWLDKNLVKSLNGQTANIPGINALHQGVEFEAKYKPTDKFSLYAMASLGDWVWMDNVEFTLFDENQTAIGTYNAFIKDVHVGNSAQVTSALGIDYEILPKFKIGVDGNYYGKNYSDFDPTTRTTSTEEVIESWQLPDAFLVDFNMNYKFQIGKLNASLYANVNNVFNTEYIADATDGANHDASSSFVWFGFGRTWSTGLRINF